MKSLKVKLSLLNLCTVVISSLKDVIASKPICNAAVSATGRRRAAATYISVLHPSGDTRCARPPMMMMMVLTAGDAMAGQEEEEEAE